MSNYIVNSMVEASCKNHRKLMEVDRVTLDELKSTETPTFLPWAEELVWENYFHELRCMYEAIIQNHQVM